MPGLGRQTRTFLFLGLVRTHKNTQGFRRSDPTDPSKRRRRHGSVFLGDVRGIFFWRLQCHRYLAVANKYHLYPGCLPLVAVSRKKNTDPHGNGNQKSARLLLLQILQSDGQSERADFSHTRVRSRKAESSWHVIRFPSHVIRSCSLKPLQVCVPSGVKQTIIAQFFSILMTGSAINIDFCFFSLRATQLIVPRWPVIKCLLIYFSGQDGGNRHYFSFFTLPSTIYQRKFITIHF